MSAQRSARADEWKRDVVVHHDSTGTLSASIPAPLRSGGCSAPHSAETTAARPSFFDARPVDLPAVLLVNEGVNTWDHIAGPRKKVDLHRAVSSGKTDWAELDTLCPDDLRVFLARKFAERLHIETFLEIRRNLLVCARVIGCLKGMHLSRNHFIELRRPDMHTSQLDGALD